MEFPIGKAGRVKMRDWPTAREYRAAVVDPDALADVALLSGVLESDAGGSPIVYLGADTVTFHLVNATGDSAFRCFLRGDDERETRYYEIGRLARSGYTTALCRTQYLPEGIRVANRWWPAVRMEWAAGRPLNAEVVARLGDAAAMDALADAFRTTVRELGALQLAHGDLQHRTIVATNEGLRLIDYDGIFVPALAGQRQTAYGHPNYQHPDRKHAPFDARLDRFSSLVIYTALRALGADPSLWARFNDGENLLFRASDFAAGRNSEVFRALLDNDATRDLATSLLAACRKPVASVPTLEETIETIAGSDAPVPAEPADAYRRQPSAPVNRAWGVAALAATLGGLTIGGGIAVWQHAAGAMPVAVASYAPVVAVVAPAAKPTYAPTPIPATPVPPTLRATATPVPATPKPSRAATTAPIAVASPPLRPLGRSTDGTWTIDEANRQVGTMVWSGPGVAHGDAMVLDVHKARVADQSASSCERETALHAVVTLDGAQDVPFREVNCAGAALVGDVRVGSVSPDRRSFRGSFWSGGTKLGDFVASRQ